MGWFTDFLTGSASKIIDSVGGAIDRNVTNEEERLQLRNELEQAIQGHTQEMAEKANQFEKEVSRRHENDMQSDSWLSKNIRPLSLAFLLITTVLLAYSTIFADLSETQVQSLKAWIPMLSSLLGTAFVFYFGSRGIEKAMKMRGGKGN